ncbi:MAG: CHAT domain-containing protein, partial [Duncaniella sp.]|nr:CHAT domain-containing protein [Duncaniella sp.]
GAGTLVMSLWEASEKSATLFMSTFYSELAQNGFDSHNAFAKARSAVRERFPEPFYWAGFILVD